MGTIESPIQSVHFNLPPFFLSSNRANVARQLAGAGELETDYSSSALLPDVDTDAIIPADACKTPEPEFLAEHVLTGLPGSGVKPGDLTQLYRNVWVVGPNFGCGSSREHAPVAIMNSGCGLVIAESFAPIFRRNAVTLGLWTSTDFGLLDLIRDGDPVPLERLVSDHDPLSREIIMAGGLLPYLGEIERGKRTPPRIETQARPMTIAEKWIAKNLGVPFVQPGDAGFVIPGYAYTYEYTAPLSIKVLQDFDQNTSIHDRSQLVFFNDHLPLDTDLRSAQLEKITRQFAQANGIQLYDAIGEQQTSRGPSGICHVVMADKVTPGINVGTDSHTSMIAFAGGFVFGIGATDFAGIMKSGMVMVTTPESVRLNLHGGLRPYVTIRDLMLSLIAQDRNTRIFANRVMEFGGPALQKLTVAQLAVMGNMTVEASAVTAAFDPNLTTANYLYRTGRSPSVTAALAQFPTADRGAVYSTEQDLILSTIEPTVALPSKPHLGVPLSEVPQTWVNKVVIGSCVGGGIEDIRLTAYILRGQRVRSNVELTVHPHSRAVYQYAQRQGWLDWIRKAGGTVIEDIGCGACIGNGPGTLVENDICFTTASRNHVGRMGHPSARVFLASAPVCAVTALIGGTPTLQDLQGYTQQVPWHQRVTLFSLQQE